MKIVNVTYTAKPEFVEKNKANINDVMCALREINAPGINYTCCLGSDGKTFNHRTYFGSEADQKTLNDLPSFQKFQTELKAAGFEVPPKQDHMSLVASSVDVL